MQAHLAEDGQIVEVHVELELERVEREDDEERGAVDGQRGDVDGRRVATPQATPQPDGRRQRVADEPDQQPRDDDHPVEADRVRDELLEQQRAGVPRRHRPLVVVAVAAGRHRM